MIKKVLISYGHKKRDFEYLCLLAAVLKQQGFLVEVMYTNFEVYQRIFSWQPDFLILGQVNQNENIALSQYARRSGVKVIVLNCEGTYDETKYKSLFGSAKDFDLMIAWGQQQASDVIHHDHFPSKKVVVWGTPKFDVYQPQVFGSKLFPVPYQLQLDSQKKTIVVATSFPLAQTTWQDISYNQAYQGLGQKRFEKIVKDQKYIRDEFINLAKGIAALKKYNLIFRIHPTEDETYYLQSLKNCQDIIFDNTVAPASLFKVTDVLIHRTSTLATEAWIKNIFTVSFDPVDKKDSDLFPFTEIDRQVTTRSQLIQFLKKQNTFVVSQTIAQRRKKYLERWYNLTTLDSHLAAQKIAQQLKNLPAGNRHRIFNQSLVIYVLLAVGKRIFGKKYLYEVIGLVKKEPYLKLMRLNYTTAQEVKQKIRFIQQQVLSS